MTIAVTGAATNDQPLTFSSLFEPTRTDEQRDLFSATAQAAQRFASTLPRLLEEARARYAIRFCPRPQVPPLPRLSEAAQCIWESDIDEAQQDRRARLFDRLRVLGQGWPGDYFVDRELSDPDFRTLYHECRTRDIVFPPPVVRHMFTFISQEKDIKRSLHGQESFSAEKERLVAELNTLEPLLSNPPPADAESLDNRNHAILLSLRRVCSSPLYNALRCTNGHPLTELVHSLVLSQSTNTTVAPTFEKLGQRLDNEHLPLQQRVQATWDRISKIGINNGFCDTLSHFSLKRLISILIPFIALKIAQLFSIEWLARWAGDERSIAGNTPGALYDDKNAGRTIRTIALAAPTVGSQGSPEFRAALQALENNQYSPTSDSFVTWSYTNLQNLGYTPEHDSTIALMRLQEEFPLSFHSITLQQHLPSAPNDDFSERDVEHHLSLIRQPISTKLRNIDSDDAGYYFPTPFFQSQREAIERIARMAFDLLAPRSQDLPAATLKQAYQRLLHLGISRLHETYLFARVASRLHRSAVNALRSMACASCIDRGGVMNAAYLHGIDPSGKNSNLALGTYFGRALTSHRRSPTPASYDNLSGFLGAVDGRQLNRFLSSIQGIYFAPHE